MPLIDGDEQQFISCELFCVCMNSKTTITWCFRVYVIVSVLLCKKRYCGDGMLIIIIVMSHHEVQVQSEVVLFQGSLSSSAVDFVGSHCG